MNTNNKKIFIFFTLLFFASACCKKGVTTYITDPELKNFTSIQTGTYYIYRDSITGVEDSVWVVNNIKSILPVNSELLGKNYNRKCEDLFEYISIKIQNQKNKYWEFQVRNKGIRFFGFPINELYLHIPFNIGAVTSSGYTSNKNLQFYPNYTLKGENYTNVYQIDSKVYFNNSSDTTFGTTLFSTTTGLLKYSLKNDTSFHVYEIVRNQIIK